MFWPCGSYASEYHYEQPSAFCDHPRPWPHVPDRCKKYFAEILEKEVFYYEYAIDLNCDLGESFGAYHIGMDDAVIPFISSANVACGFHAADPLVMEKTVALCKETRCR